MESTYAAKPLRILIVDAYGHSREGLSAALRRSDFIVETAAGSWEAINRMKDGCFGLAVIDLDLPPAHGVAMNGWELARIFRAFNPGAAAIFVTAERYPELDFEAERLAHAQVMEKPINPAQLRSLVKALRSELLQPAEPGQS